MKKNKSKDRISNFVIALILLLIFSSIGLYFYLDHKKIKKHYEECVEICKPNPALEILSKEGCFCQESEQENFDRKNSI